jgi:hypothetical protein
MNRYAGMIKHCNTAIILLIALYFFLLPGIIIVRWLCDPGISGPRIPRFAFALHRSLTSRYERWACVRMSSGRAGDLSTENISGTEWPLFGSVFYLWATVSLQEAWEDDNGLASAAPMDYAGKAVDAAAALVADPGHAAWVKEHWGGDYLHTENVFYRKLVIAALTAHVRLTKSDKYADMLLDQVETLSAELAGSPHGLLNDYPTECYPTDVMAAVACIGRADDVLGMNHGDFIEDARRAFTGECLDEIGLPPYAADTETGRPLGPSRGCGQSYMCILAPEIWPDTAARWYRLYEKHFWQYRMGAWGFREFSFGSCGGDWYIDVDSGPVIAGHGVAASAFGVAAARANGRFDHAYPLSAEMIVTCWPLPDGTLAIPRILSNSVDAPYLGEAGILFIISCMPVEGVPVVSGGSITPYVYIVLAGFFVMGILLMVLAFLGLRKWRRTADGLVPYEKAQFVFWCLLLAAGAGLFVWRPQVGLLMILLAQYLPREKKPGTTGGSGQHRS